MLPEWVSKIEPRTRTPIYALLLMVIPSLIISYLYAYNILSFSTIALDATLVIAVTFLGTAVAAIVLPWRQKGIFEGSPVAKYGLPSIVNWIVMLLYVVAGGYLVYLMVTYGGQVFAQWADQTSLTQAMIVLVALLSLINVVLLVYILAFVGRRMLAGDRVPLVTSMGLVFFTFLDWLLVEWFWDPGYLYGIGWQNSTSMLFMVIMYTLAAVIYFGFSAYRRRQGIDVDKVYKEIPVE
jgi:amino acid transporter